MEAGKPVTKPRLGSWLAIVAVAVLGCVGSAWGAAKEPTATPKAQKAAPPASAKATPAKPPAAKPKQSPIPVASPTPKPEPEDDGPLDAGKSEKEPAKTSGLPIPRFVSLRTDAVNLRAGPGTRYPTEWLYVRRGLPLEIIGEFDTWRRVRDPDGTEGWVHQSTLSGRRTAVIVNTPALLKREANDQGQLVATLEPGVVVNVQRCPADAGFCRVEINGMQGWLNRERLWGVYPGEPVQ